MRTYVNTDVHSRVWTHLSYPEGTVREVPSEAPGAAPATVDLAGRTVELAPGETVALDLPGDFTDAWLKPVPATASKKPAASPAPTTTTEPAPSSDAVKEI